MPASSFSRAEACGTPILKKLLWQRSMVGSVFMMIVWMYERALVSYAQICRLHLPEKAAGESSRCLGFY